MYIGWWYMVNGSLVDYCWCGHHL